MDVGACRMHVLLLLLTARAMAARRSILYIQSTKDNKYLNLKGDFVEFDRIKSTFQTELEAEKGTPPYIKIRDEKNRHLSVKDDTLWWTDDDLGFKWNSSFVETGGGVLSDQNGKCFAREATQITLRDCSDIINDTEVSRFKLIFVPTEEEIKHARSVLEASKEQNRMLSREYDNARRGDDRPSRYSPGVHGDGYGAGSPRGGIGDSTPCPMRKSRHDEGAVSEDEERYGSRDSPKLLAGDSGPQKREASVPSTGIEANLYAKRLRRDRDFGSAALDGASRPPKREQGSADDLHGARSYSKAASDSIEALNEQAGQRAAHPFRPDGRDSVSSDSIKALDDLKRMLGENQMEVSRMAKDQRERVKGDVSEQSAEALAKLKDDISRLKRENEERLGSPETKSAASGQPEGKHDKDHDENVRRIKETLQNMQEHLEPLLKKEAAIAGLRSPERRPG